MFKGLAISKLETEWKTYPVVKISFGGGRYENSESLKKTLNFTLSEYEKKYGISIDENEIFSVRMKRLILKIHEATKKSSCLFD